MTPEFKAYIAPARLYPQIWRLLLGILLIVFIYAGFTALVLAGVFAATMPFGFFPFLMELASPSKPVPTLVLLFSLIGFGLGAIIAAPACHYRSPATLFGPLGETLRGFLITVAICLAFFIVFGALTLVFSSVAENLPFDQWLRFLPLAVPLVLLQTASEELVFRAYLPQQLAARFTSRAVWMVVPALLFSLLHFNPKFGPEAWMIVATVFAFALIATDLVEQTGSLGAAIGLHFVNNLFALLVIAMDETITGLSLYVSPLPAGMAQWAVSVAINLALLLVLWRILRYALTR